MHTTQKQLEHSRRHNKKEVVYTYETHMKSREDTAICKYIIGIFCIFIPSVSVLSRVFLSWRHVRTFCIIRRESISLSSLSWLYTISSASPMVSFMLPIDFANASSVRLRHFVQTKQRALIRAVSNQTMKEC